VKQEGGSEKMLESRRRMIKIDLRFPDLLKGGRVEMTGLEGGGD